MAGIDLTETKPFGMDWSHDWMENIQNVFNSSKVFSPLSLDPSSAENQAFSRSAGGGGGCSGLPAV